MNARIINLDADRVLCRYCLHGFHNQRDYLVVGVIVWQIGSLHTSIENQHGDIGEVFDEGLHGRKVVRITTRHRRLPPIDAQRKKEIVAGNVTKSIRISYALKHEK